MLFLWCIWSVCVSCDFSSTLIYVCFHTIIAQNLLHYKLSTMHTARCGAQKHTHTLHNPVHTKPFQMRLGRMMRCLQPAMCNATRLGLRKQRYSVASNASIATEPAQSLATLEVCLFYKCLQALVGGSCICAHVHCTNNTNPPTSSQQELQLGSRFTTELPGDPSQENVPRQV